MSLNHISSPPLNPHIGFSGRYWHLLILGASASVKAHFSGQMPRLSPQILIHLQRFGESAHDPMKMILFIQ